MGEWRHWTLLLMVVYLILAVTSASGQQGIPAPESPQAQAMTEEEKQDILYLHKHTQPGAPYRLNLAHPNQYRHVINALRRAGTTADTAPQMFRSLAAARTNGTASPPVLAVQADGSPQALNYISTFDLHAAPGTFQASGLSSVYRGTEATSIVIDLYSVERNHVYAANQGRTTQYAQGTYFKVPVSGTVPANLNDRTTAIPAHDL